MDIDLNSPDCRLVLFGSAQTLQQGLITRYSDDLDEQEIYIYSGMNAGPARGSIGMDGTLWTAINGGISKLMEWSPPPDW
jgi:hypothetical protein